LCAGTQQDLGHLEVAAMLSVLERRHALPVG
jgi:hypothetical protein